MGNLRSILIFLVLSYICMLCPKGWAYSAEEDTQHLEINVPKLCMPVSYRYNVVLSEPPIIVGMLGDRYNEVNEALQGWNESGIPLVGKWSGKWEPVPCGDDSGLFYIAPLLARTAGWGADRALNVFYGTLLLLSVGIALIGFSLTGGGVNIRVAKIIAVLIAAYIVHKVGDVYLVQGAVTLMAVPWIYYWYRKHKITVWILVSAFALGFALGIAQWIRSQSAVPIAMLAIILFGLSSWKRHYKLFMIAAMLTGIMLPLIYANALVHRRNRFLVANSPDFHPSLNHHLLWHTIYVGLGYLNNPYVAGWKDTLAADYAESVDPAVIYGSAEYETILKHRVITIIKEDPRFIFYTVTAKSGTLIVFLICCMNISLARFVKQYKRPIEMAFGIVILYSAIPGLIATPVPQYVITMIVLAIGYWIVSFQESALQTREIRRIEQTIPAAVNQ